MKTSYTQDGAPVELSWSGSGGVFLYTHCIGVEQRLPEASGMWGLFFIAGDVDSYERDQDH